MPFHYWFFDLLSSATQCKIYVAQGLQDYNRKCIHVMMYALDDCAMGEKVSLQVYNVDKKNAAHDDKQEELSLPTSKIEQFPEHITDEMQHSSDLNFLVT